MILPCLHFQWFELHKLYLFPILSSVLRFKVKVEVTKFRGVFKHFIFLGEMICLDELCDVTIEILSFKFHGEYSQSASSIK